MVNKTKIRQELNHQGCFWEGRDIIVYKKCVFFIAFSNDISCDFESEQWDTGFCNWQYDFSSKNILVRVDAPSSDYSIKRKWKYGNFSIIIILHF